MDRKSQVGEHQLDIVPHSQLGPWRVAKQVRRVKCRHKGDAPEIGPGPPELGYLNLDAQQVLAGCGSEGHDNLGVNGLDLGVKEGQAC